MTTEKITIALTNRKPVKIDENEWPVIAMAKSWDGTYESQANRTWRLLVRQHYDGRAIVYGRYRSSYQGARGAHAGELCEAGNDLIAAINRVAVGCGCEHLAQDCIADLPAEEI